MSKKCYLEVYSRYTTLTNQEEVEYWNKYMEIVEPVLSDVKSSMDYETLKNKVNELLPEYKEGLYPLAYYSKVGEDYFVSNGYLCYGDFIPNTYLMPFKNYQKELFYEDHFDDPDYDDIPFEGAYLKYETTVDKGLALMKKRIKTLEDLDFKKSCNQIVDFLKSKPLDSILVLNSGDIYTEYTPDYVLEEISKREEMFLRMDKE